MFNTLKKLSLTFALAMVAVFTLAGSALAAPATAESEMMPPPPSCGDSFQVSIGTGSNIRVVGVDLGQFGYGYMLVYTSMYGEGHGPYNASSFAGANFTFDSGVTSHPGPGYVNVSLTNSENTLTLCSSTYNLFV